MKKVVSFSLWCQENKLNPKNQSQNKNMYINGAYENLKLKNKYYKDWIFRFYVDNTVSDEVKDNIIQLGGEIKDMTGITIPGMYWRFLPIQDNDVDLFIVRDIDSRISLREEQAVNQWIKSDKIMHVMRDHPHHYYKILGGMWGFKNTITIDFNTLLDEFLRARNYSFKRMDDMYFLDKIYDHFEKNNQVLAHDAYFKISKNSLDFPCNIENQNIKKNYNYVGEIFDENNREVTLERDHDLQLNYKTIMNNHWSKQYWK